MTYHISLFTNNSGSTSITANVGAQRDTYFVTPKNKAVPGHNVEIHKGNYSSYEEAFENCNFIYTGVHAYSFWDSGASQIFAMTNQDARPEVLYKGEAGDLTLTVNPDGTIDFSRSS